MYLNIDYSNNVVMVAVLSAWHPNVYNERLTHELLKYHLHVVNSSNSPIRLTTEFHLRAYDSSDTTVFIICL